jgi:hypothetical protein
MFTLLYVIVFLRILYFFHVEISFTEAMAPRLPRRRLTCGSNQRNWLITLAMQRSGSMGSTDGYFLF